MPRSTRRERQRDRRGGRKFRKKADRKQKVRPHTRKKYWVAGYTRRDGVHVKGHMARNAWYRTKKRRRRK